MRKAFVFIHRWLGWIAAVPLILLALSGAVIAFEAEIDRALNPSFWKVTPSGQRLPWREVIAAVQKAYPSNAVGGLNLPPAPDVAAQVSLNNGLMLGVDPYTGRVLGSRRREQVLTSTIHRFHTQFLLGPVGSLVAGWSALVLVVLAGTGIVLWWRRKVLRFGRAANWRRVNYDAHSALGFYGLVPWVILALTGAAMTFDAVTRATVEGLTGSTAAGEAPKLHSAPAAAGARRLSVDEALEVAGRTLPGAAVTLARLPIKPADVYTIYLKYPEDHTPAGRSHVAIDSFSGQVVWMDSSRTAPAATRLLNLNRPLHTGDIFGWPTRILASAACVLLAWQVVSGLWIAWPRRKNKGGKTSAEVDKS